MKPAHKIHLKRVYEPPAETDGRRFLVERFWPRGIKKEDLHIDGWLKDAAPGTELRKWFNHDLGRWVEFQKRYFAELKQKVEAWKPIIQAAKEKTVTLLYSSRDAEHNNAVALKTFLEHR